MKTTFFIRRVFVGATILANSLLITSCEKDDYNDNMNNTTYSVSGNASGSQESPAVTTGGTATLTGTYNAGNNLLNYTINWTGLTGLATVMHFHGPGAIGVTANPIHNISITTNGINGSATGNLTLADSTEAHLLNGRIYYNIHTATYPNGEIRGQVTATPN